jgi:cell division protein FtsZ
MAKKVGFVVRLDESLWERFSSAVKIDDSNKNTKIEQLIRTWLDEKENGFKVQSEVMIIGLGGAGINSINKLGELLNKTKILAISTDSRGLSLLNSPNIEKLLLGEQVVYGLGCDGNQEIGSKIANMNKEIIRSKIKNSKIVFISAGLGGGTGGGMLPVIVDIAKNEGAMVVVVGIYPFKMERTRVINANKVLYQLSKKASTLILFDNNILIKKMPNSPIEKAFGMIDTAIANMFYNLISQISTPALINLEYKDTLQLLEKGGLGTFCSFYSDSDDLKKIDEQFENNCFTKFSKKQFKDAIITITGGLDLTLGEANEIGERLAEAIDPQATVVWGAKLVDNFPPKNARVDVMALGVDWKNISNL